MRKNYANVKPGQFGNGMSNGDTTTPPPF